MKTPSQFLLFIIAGLLAACSATDEPTLKVNGLQKSNSVENRFSAKQAESVANSIIAEFSNEGETRTDSPVPEIEYVLRSSNTRSVTSNDTIAYIFNYPDNGGFVMMSPNPNVEEPLIAYSDKGHLDITDNFVKDNIILPLENYLDNISVTSTRGDISTNPNIGIAYEVLEWMSPQLIISLSQESPWNKVVVANKGTGYVAGCVPVASALIMSNCKSSFTLRGRTYNFKEITKCIAINQGATGLGTTTYSYDKAVNEMAQLLWDIGQEFPSTYYVGSTGTVSSKAIAKMLSWNYVSPFSELQNLTHENNFKTYLSNGNIIYVRGSSSEGGHAWVADGYQVRRNICNIPGGVFPSYTYVHFNWGWGGSCDGYFSGTVYTPYSGLTFSGIQYCPFKYN